MSPFDAARYARLLEGLEVTELKLSAVQNENLKLRLDSAYFAKPMLEAERMVRSYRGGHDELGSLFSRFVKGVFDINADCYIDHGVPFLRILNLRHGVIDESNLAFIPETRHQEEIKTELRRGDIVLSKTAYPAASVVTLDRCNTSQDTIATSLSQYGKKTYRSEAIAAYLNSEIGARLLWRQFQGNVQLHLSLDDGRKVPIPRFGIKFQESVAKAYQRSIRLREESGKKIAQAEATLLHTLGLDDWEAPGPLTYILSSHEAFATGRLDAEFFTPHVRDMLARLGRDGLTIRDVAPARKERFTPADSGEFHYIEIGGLGADGTAQAECLPQREAPSRATQYVRAGDVITSTVRPIRRLSASIDASQDGYVCSSGFVVLQPRTIRSDVLLTYLRLPPVCALMDLHTSASMYPAISEADLLALPIPKIPEATQQVIEESVLAARHAKQRATQLLDAAKRAVEIAIEDSEAAALAWLETVAGASASCDHPSHDLPTNPASQSATPGLARQASGRGQLARGVSGEGAGFHAELDGAGKRAGGPAASANPSDSTQPLDATRELATAAGPMPYSEVAEALAENVARCLDELLEAAPEDIHLTPENLRAFHRRIAGALFPDWAGTWRSTEVQVGTHSPPPSHDVPVQVRNFCLDLDERLRHVDHAQAIAALLAWADWRFQWIHPFKDFNGRVGRILLVALTYQLGLPPLDPAASAPERQAYFDALRQADSGDLRPLSELWMRRLQDRMDATQ